MAKRRKRAKKVFCVMAGKTKVSCHRKKSAATRKAKARRKAGRKARVVKRASR